MTILEKVQLAQNSKTSIKNAIIAKGVSMDDVTFSNYGNKIAEISSGGSASNGKSWDEVMNDIYTENILGKGFTEEFCLIFVYKDVSQNSTIYLNRFSALDENGDPITGIKMMFNDDKVWETDTYDSKTIHTFEQNGNDKYCWMIIRCSAVCLNTDEITGIFSSTITGMKIIKNNYAPTIFPSRYKLYTSAYLNLEYFDMGGMWDESICTNLGNVVSQKDSIKGLYNVPSVQNFSITSFINIKNITFAPNATITASCDLTGYGTNGKFTSQGCVNCANVLSGTGNVSTNTEIDITYCENRQGQDSFATLVQSKGWTIS